jgi:glycosyltransferase involved in cell wall biosynthesis
MFVLPWELREPGGVNQVVENLFDISQRRLGCRAVLLVNTWGLRKAVVSEVDGRATVRTMIQSPSGQHRPWRHAASFLLHLPFELVRLRRLLLAQGISRINVHYPGLSALTWLALRRFLLPQLEVVLSFHGTDLREARSSRGLDHRLWAVLLAGADDITVCSEPLRKDMVLTFGAAAIRARQVLNGVDPIRVRALAQVPSMIDLPLRYILSLATFEHKKGLDTLLSAFALLAADRPDVSLVIAGRISDRNYFEDLQRQQANLPCSERIVFLPDLLHAQAMQVLSRAKAFALASRQEPFGIVVLEAGVLGIPVVATSVCGVVERLDPRREVISIPPDDASSLAAALSSVLDDECRSLMMSDALRKRVLAEFTWDQASDQYTLRSLPGPARGKRSREHPPP